MVDGQTQLVGLIGWPTAHSLSPAMLNAAFAATGLNWCYVPLPVPPDRLEAAVHGLVALGFRGANVTAPYKRSILPFLDRVDPGACALGAVNTLIVHRKGEKASIYGCNTDESGFIRALHQGGVRTGGCRALVVGAGGAARAVVSGLLRGGAEAITVLNRTPERAEQLIADLAGQGRQATRLVALPLTPGALIEAAGRATLLVNATPVGTWPQASASIWPDGLALPSHLVVFDLVYNPRRTRLLEQARASGARAMDGLEMLVQQGAIAFEMWTGEPAPIAAMRAACVEVLGEV